MKSFTQFFNKLKYLDRIILESKNNNKLVNDYINSLNEKGYVIIENFIKEELLSEVLNIYYKALEEEKNFELPCLGQSLINENKHKNLIENYFRYPPNELLKLGIGFDSSFFNSYDECINKFNPSTLKLYLNYVPELFNLWLNDLLLAVIEGYMGLRPYLLEAYIRRNFPAKYKVMNHFWHRDTNHKNYLVKAFIFLSDCDIDKGPHEYISGTITDLKLHGKIYYSDEEVDSVYNVNSICRIKSIVKAGTVILEDTRGLHRATIPISGFRDLGYAVFVPLSKIDKKSSPLYKIPIEDYNKLSELQRSYIPSQNIE